MHRYVETIDLGEGTPRQILSGLGGHMPLEAVKGSRVVCITNLRARKMAGVESQVGATIHLHHSHRLPPPAPPATTCTTCTHPCRAQGMVLCASDKDKTKLSFVSPPDGAKPGERVTWAGYPGEPQSSVKQMEKKKAWEQVAESARARAREMQMRKRPTWVGGGQGGAGAAARAGAARGRDGRLSAA